MAYQPIQELLPRCNGSIYRLVRVASLRALEISLTGTSLINKPSSQKSATIALEEIRAGKVYDKVMDDMPKKKAK